jgi:hypothetical protein
VVARKPSRDISPYVIKLLRQRDLPELGFVPEDHLFWSSEPRNVAFAGWSGQLQVKSMGVPWHVGPSGLTAFTGHLWPKGGMWHEGESWARQLQTRWLRRPVKSSVQDLDGIYTALSLSTSGEGTLTTDPLSIAMLYRAETTEFVVYSSRAALAARVASPPGQEPQRDPLGVAWLAFWDNPVGEQTSFVNTVVLPSGASVDVHPNWGSRVHLASSTPWVADFTPGLSDDDLVGLVHDDLARSMQSVSLLPARQHFADLTGGKDSRLVLALLLEAGLTDKFTFQTIGAPHSADAIVAKAIVAEFSLDHEAIDSGPMDPAQFRSRLGTHVFQTSGMLNAWDLKGGLGVTTRPHASGAVGELMRTHFHGFPVVSTPEENFAACKYRSDRLTLLHTDVRAEYERTLRAEVCERLDSGGCTAEDLLDAFYIRGRLRRWFGAADEIGEQFRVNPLYSLRAAQAAFALGPIKRRGELLHFEIMRRACDRLAKIPFANATWSTAVASALGNPDEYRRPPQTATSEATVDWQATRLEARRDVLESYLLDEPSNPVFEVISRDVVQKVLAGPALTDNLALRGLYGALTAAVWLGRHEIPARVGEPTS